MTIRRKTATAVSPALGNVFTVDVEDYFHVQAFADQIDPKTWDQYESRVERNTHKVLRLLDRWQTRGTFFVLGWVAERHPQLVRDIQLAGHEIGCHSHMHQLVYRQSQEEFRADLRRATRVLENITGTKVEAYRAPCFSVTAGSMWALDILIDEGYRVDSSVFPVRHDTYGVPGIDPAPHLIERPNGRILEFPPAVRCKRFANIPVAGGGYFRLLPLRLSLHWLRNINRKESRPVMFYIHPWELDPEQPRISCGRKSQFRHYLNLETTERKLDRILGCMKFDTLASSVSELRFDQERPKTRDAAITDTVVNFDLTAEIDVPQETAETGRERG